MRERIVALALFPLLMAACSTSPDEATGPVTDISSTRSTVTTTLATSTAPTSEASTSSALTTVATTVIANGPLVISASGIGPALLGMTADEMQAALGPEYTVAPQDAIRVDFSGYDIVYNGEVVFSANQSFEGDFLDAFITNHPAVAFANGIGPGSGLGALVAEFGPGTLAFSYSNEGREFFDFDADSVVPANASIETQLGGGGHAGLYTTDNDYNETTEFDPAGEVKAIWLFCTAPEGFNPCPD